MAETLEFIAGEVKRLDHIVDAGDNSQFVIDSVTCSIWDATGNAIISNAPATGHSTLPAASHEIYYLWDTTSVQTGEYTYSLSYTVGTQTIAIRGRAVVISPSSKIHRYVNRVRDWLVESELGEAQRVLSWWQIKGAIDDAINAYSGKVPQRKNLTQALTSGAFEYDLPADFIPTFSEIEWFEYPVDDTNQTRTYLETRDYEVDLIRGKWRFLWIAPGTGTSARLTYTTTQTLTDTTDTLPATDFDGICQYAAGSALLQAANRAASTSAPNVAADVVNYRTKQQEYRQQGLEMQRLGMAGWSDSANLRPFENWSYLPYHGKVYASW